MSDLIRKTVWTGLGLAYLTHQRIAEAAKRIAEERKISYEEGKKLLDQLHEETEKAREKVKTELEDRVKKTLETLNIPTKEDITKIEESLKKLEKAMKAK
jgi:polyhydroxyalkanoate synthesis regulator phasin